MSYYMRGDYYRGDYYRGDPGLGSFLKKAAKAVVGGVTGFITGGPVGAAVGAGSAIFGKGTGAKAGAVGGVIGSLLPTAPAQPGSGFNIGPVNINPAAILPGGAPLFSAAQGGLCPSGFHQAKDGSGRCVRNRSMNPLNPRALRRGLRRAEAFERIARRTVNGLRSGPKKFKSRARRK